MAARLEWDGLGLRCGPWILATLHWRPRLAHWNCVVNANGEFPVEAESWESRQDAEQDVITEVRRLLREAGVVVE